MAAKKASEMSTELELPEEEAEQGDVIVLKKSLVINIGIAVVFFILGAVASYVLFAMPAQATQAALLQQQLQAAQGPAQPTQPPARLSNVGLGKLPPQGSPDAPVKIVEFSDFQCPFCKAWQDDTASALLQKYGTKVVLYYRHFPLTQIHPEAMKGAMAAECANEQGKFWDMHDSLFRTQSAISPENSKQLAAQLGLDTTQFNQCLDSNKYQANIQADISDGNSYGVDGTPTFFINGVRLVGALPLAQFTAVIDQELAGK